MTSSRSPDLRLRAHELFRGRIATVRTGGIRLLREMSARIDWGDARKSHATIGGFGRDFEVYGHHHWRVPGVYNVKVEIRDGFTGQWISRYLRARVAPQP